MVQILVLLPASCVTLGKLPGVSLDGVTCNRDNTCALGFQWGIIISLSGMGQPTPCIQHNESGGTQQGQATVLPFSSSLALPEWQCHYFPLGRL